MIKKLYTDVAHDQDPEIDNKRHTLTYSNSTAAGVVIDELKENLSKR